MPHDLSRDDALALLDELIDAYETPEFQHRLNDLWCSNDYLSKQKYRQKLCLEIQAPIVAKYGFDASYRGVIAYFKALQRDDWVIKDPDIAPRNKHIAWLLDPDMQAKQKPWRGAHSK